MPNQSAQHCHDTLEVYFLREGSCRHEIAGKEYEVTAGDVLLILPGTRHKTERYSRTYTRLLINCTEAYVAPQIRAALDSGRVLYRDPTLAKEAERIFASIEAETAKRDRFTRDALTCLVSELLILLLRREEAPQAERSNHPVESTVRYIEANYMTEITLPALAALHAITPDHLSRIFKKETGYGVREYLTLVRLRKAEFMLRNEPGRSISEIAFACGFNDSNYFSDKFRKAYGVTPSSVRKAGKKVENA